jgi:hypothetical protein
MRWEPKRPWYRDESGDRIVGVVIVAALLILGWMWVG